MELVFLNYLSRARCEKRFPCLTLLHRLRTLPTIEQALPIVCTLAERNTGRESHERDVLRIT